MATIETKVVPIGGRTISFTRNDSDDTVRWTDPDGTARSIAFTLANWHALVLCCADGVDNIFQRYTRYL